MAVKIIAFLLTAIVNAAAGVAIFFIMLLVMNGYSESDATWGLGVYIILALSVTLTMGAGAAFMVNLLVKKEYSAVVSALVAVLLFSIVGIGLKVVCSGIGVGIAEIVRNH